ncbi:MAG: IS110 family transposase, partial [Cypionkella sp.]|nr:IS110 family transposase [Cypionkella sp.]
MGIDLAKSVFQMHGADSKGRLMMSQRLRRDQVLPEVAKLPACVIGIVACTGAFFWQRQFETLGHTVRIIAPQYVKPFVKHQKSHRNDAEAICTAMRQPNMKFVPTKNEVQQD